jgi:hypothetical protein
MPEQPSNPEPKFTFTRPRSPRRAWISVVPEYAKGSAEALIERTAHGAPGAYRARYVFNVPGREFFFGDGNVTHALESGDSLVVLPDVNTGRVKLWDLRGTAAAGIAEAHVISDESGKLTSAVFDLTAESFEDAARKTHNFLMPFLSWLSFHGDRPMEAKSCEIVECRTKSWRWYAYMPGQTVNFTWTPQNDLNITDVPPRIRALQATYREAMNAMNVFYKFLCFWKVAEGCEAARKTRQRRGRPAIPSIAVPEQIPASVNGSDIDPEEGDYFKLYLGQDFPDVRESLTVTYRNAVAHMISAGPPLHPDDFDDVFKCENALSVMRYIARRMLQNEVAVG